jgi:stage II sporulation protein D
MARLTVLVAALVPLLAGGVDARPRQTEPVPVVTFSVTGRGWGHGVGMSQWGAYGFAQRGHDYGQILAHYYPGTELGRATIPRMRVLLADAKAVLNVGSQELFVLKDGTGTTYELEGTHRFGPGLRLKVDPNAEPRALVGPLVFSAKGAPLELNGKPYRGTLEVSVDRGKLRVVNHVGLEAYLFGVVPREVPAEWPEEALKAQAVVARSYAIAVRRTGGAFDVFADVRSQVYGGIEAEEQQTTAAVLATVGQVLLHEGKVATTYFFSTSGGRTANIADVWTGSLPVPYLVSVPDPYDSASPHHTWGPVAVPAQKAATALRLAAPPVDGRVTVNGSARAAELVLTLADGSETIVSAADARAKLGLRSTWFRVGVLSLRPPAKRVVTYGTRVRLPGFARGVSGVVLERRIVGSVWEKAADIKPARDGSFRLAFKPELTADYRLAAPKLAAESLRLSVAPNVKLEAPASPTSLRGTARPAFPGATVVIQRQEGTRWVKAATAVLDEAGAFEAAFELVPGTYRARLAPGRGFAAGISRVLNVEDA